MNYTKGTWRAEQLNATSLAFTVDGKSFAYVSFPLPGMDNPKAFADKAQEAWGDVHVMLAAPKLYESLKNIIGYAEAFRATIEGEGGRTEEEYIQQMSLAHQALAEVEGK